jgi:flagellar biosynthesis protein FliP
MEIETLLLLWFMLYDVMLTIQSFTEQIAILTTQITAVVIALAALSYALGVGLGSTPVTNIVPSLSEHGARLKMDSIKALFTIGIYGGIVNIVTWTVALLNSIG